MHYEPRVGGQEMYIDNLINICNQHGIQSDVIQPFNFQAVKKNKTNIICTPAIPKLPSWAKWFVFNFFLRLYRSKLKHYDVLICHYPFHYPAIKWHKKIIVVSHGILFDKNPTTLFDKYLEATSRLVFHEPCSLVSNDTDFLSYNHINADPSKDAFTEIKAGVWYIPNCIDTRKFSAKETDRQNNIVVVRNIRPDRGIDLAIGAFALFTRSIPNYQLRIAGGIGDTKYFQQCQQLIKQLNIGNQVTFVGHLNRAEVVKEYLSSKISLVPSLAKEGTSLSALESMSCGTPVVSTSIGGLIDLPTLKAAPQAKDMAQAMEEVAADWQFYSSKQKNEVQKFNLDNWGNAWLKVIASITKNPLM